MKRPQADMLCRLSSWSIALSLSLSATAAIAADDHQTASELMQVCIDRAEQEGIVNIRKVEIRAATDTSVQLAGGESRCFVLPAGRQELTLTFFYPYGGPNEAPRYWTTNPYTVAGQAGDHIHLDLIRPEDNSPNDPGWENTGWHNMWRLVPHRN